MHRFHQFPRQPSFCERRGFHGPFINQDKYNRHPQWQGMGDCLECGLTCGVLFNETRRREQTADAR